MKHLKRINENYDFRDDIIELVEDIVLDLDLENIKYKIIKDAQYGKYGEDYVSYDPLKAIAIDIERSEYFNFDEYSPVLLRLKHITDEKGLSIDIEVIRDTEFVEMEEFLDDWYMDEYNFLSFIIYKK